MKSASLLFAATACAVSATALPGQTSAQTSANRFIPDNSAVVFRMASPTKMGEQFRSTKVAKLMQTDAMTPFVDGFTEEMDQTMEMLRSSGEFDVDLVEGLLKSWRGDLIFSAQVDWDGMLDAMQYGDMPSFSFVIALTPDGEFDLSAVAKEFERMIENDSNRGTNLRDMVVGDLTLRRQDNGGEEPDVVLPFMLEDHLVILAGSDLEKSAAKLIGQDSRFQKPTNDAPIYMSLEVGKLIETVTNSVDNAILEVGDVMSMFGLTALQDLSIKIRPNEESVMTELQIGMAEEGRGIFDMFVASDKQPKLLQAVPVNSDAFSVSTVNMAPLYTVIADMWTLAADTGGVPISFDGAMEAFTEMTKVRMKEDLIDHLGTEMLSVQSPTSFTDPAGYEDTAEAMFTGTTYGLALRDGEAFAASIEKMIRSRGMHVGRKKEKYGDVTINRMKLAGLIELEYVIDNDLFLISFGGDEGSLQNLRGILDARASDEQELPNVVQKYGDAFPPGWSGIGAMPIGAILTGRIAGLQATGEFGSELDMFAGVINMMVQDMDRLNLSSILRTSYCDDESMRFMIRW